METQSDPLVWYILVPLFVAVGVYLLIYSRRRRAMLKRFARERGLSYRPRDEQGLADELTEKLAVDGEGLVRAFMGVKDLVSDGRVTLFRCTELLDLNPHRRAQDPHGNHICVLFEAPEEIDLFFRMERDGEVRNLHPPGKVLGEDEAFGRISQVLHKDPPPNGLTVSFRNGKALIYANPLVTGGEKREDLDYLLRIGRRLDEALT